MFNSYQQTIDYLFTRLPMFSRIGAAAYKPSLDNTIALCAGIKNPQNSFKTIHVAGTNGKGSVSHMLAAILQKAGHKTGLYTSPHLKDFRERIKVNGQMCSKDFVVSFTQKINPLIEQLNPSFFEITVAMAFDYFAEQQVDVAVIETGLGGRLDSTNIITPQLSIITNIGYDHVQLLGNTLDKIAFEKAGIIKRNVPIVIGEVLPETQLVFEQKALAENATIFYAEREYALTTFNVDANQLSVEYLHQNNVINLQTDLLGIYQTKNIATVLTAVNELNKMGFIINRNDISEALKNVQLITGFAGRWQVLHQQPLIVADVAHNTDGIQQLLHQLKQTSYQQLHVVTGMVKDKDVSSVLSQLPTNAVYYFTQANIPRAMAVNELFVLATTHHLNGTQHSNVNKALAAAIGNAQKEDLILICGSVFLVGEIETDWLTEHVNAKSWM